MPMLLASVRELAGLFFDTGPRLPSFRKRVRVIDEPSVALP
jgi:hypothetical protein